MRSDARKRLAAARDVRADAWDEGYEAAEAFFLDAYADEPANPYRTIEPTS